MPPPDQLSWGAVDRRLRRIMTPRVTGEFKVPKAVVDQWNDKTTRPRVMSMFEKAGYSPDRVHGRVVGFRWPYQYIINIYIQIEYNDLFYINNTDILYIYVYLYIDMFVISQDHCQDTC